MNPYHILGVPETATRREVKRAYRKLVRDLHPDHNHVPEAADRYKEVSAAYQEIAEAWRKQDQWSQAAVRHLPVPVRNSARGTQRDRAVGVYQDVMANNNGMTPSRITVWC